MKQVLIVDDDTIIRITLRTLVDWESLGYEIAADAIHGEQALRLLEKQHIDLVITDMKMPVMDGLCLLEAMNRLEQVPKALVLSGYDDFKLVREAFRLGAYDYLLKADLSGELMTAMLSRLNEEIEERKEEEKPVHMTDGQMLAEMAMGKRLVNEQLFDKPFVVIQFEIDDFYKHALRFGENAEEELVKPMIQFAEQIPRVASRCVLGAISPSRYVMLYRISEGAQYEENVVSTCRQLCSNWKNYMNLPVSAGISPAGQNARSFLTCFEEAGRWLKLHPLKGKASICHPWEKGTVSYEQVVRTGETYEKLLHCLWVGDELGVSQEKQRFLSQCHQEGIEQAGKLCLYLICQLAWNFKENHDDLQLMFGEEINYYQKVGRLSDLMSLELWINNYFRWILDYAKHQQDRKQEDLMMRAKRFIMDNYANPELTLGSVAGFVGLNEKYFSSRFTKEEGTTFSNYLTEVRIRKAKELMEQTDLKIYEISQSVGYNSVEHFTRVFKKLCKVSPGGYRK